MSKRELIKRILELGQEFDKTQNGMHQLMIADNMSYAVDRYIRELNEG